MSNRARRYMSKRDRACDSCRTKKAACRIDRSPPCYLCTLHGKECTFMQPTSRPRPPFLNRVRPNLNGEMNPLLGFQAVSVGDSTEDSLMALDNDAASVVLTGPQGFPDIFERSGASVSGVFEDGNWATGFSPGNFFCTSPQPPGSQQLKDVETPNTTIPATLSQEVSVCLDTHVSMTAQLLGSSGDMDPSLISRYQYDTSGAFRFKNLNIQSISSGSNPTQFLMSNPSVFGFSREENGCSKVSTIDTRQKLELLVPADIGRRLITLFDTIILSQYPLLGPSGQLDPKTTPPHFLASAYLIVEPFTKFDEKLCIDLAYDKPSAVALHQIINDAILYEIHAPKLCIIRTLLTLVIRPYPNPIVLDSGLKWTQLSTLVACAHTLGLHLDPKSWQISSREIFQRRSLSCLIYSTDKWLALSLGRPPLLTYDNWLVAGLSQSDYLISGLDPLAWSNVMKKAELDSLLDRVLVQLYSPRAVNELCGDVQRTVAITGPLLQELHSWHKESFTSSSQPCSSDQGRSVRQDRTLEMSYHYIHLIICRAFLRPFLQPAAELSNDAPGAEYLMTYQQARISGEACIMAAARFIHDLRPEDVETVWPAWSATAFSSICFQILEIAARSGDRREADKWVACLRDVRRDMRLKAEFLPCLHLGLLRIDSIFWKGVENVLHLHKHVREAFAC
ncbi:uncharacterized protein N7511_004665 [Penicillium nucicola]|uniref:uncharacterized protein n=1 Tax=Penicillium nucicola TaxID=1850975 RepID=UPI002545B5F9|nr:uncharacterized protein N7511_004665 [Penicillium nucicola]KAJ5767049.1 hypothetical protein N7511_004665 [Penicillium nucicola]